MFNSQVSLQNLSNNFGLKTFQLSNFLISIEILSSKSADIINANLIQLKLK